MTEKDNDNSLGYEIWLSDANKAKIMTGEVFALLMEIERSGSLVKAAGNINISYRRAWSLLRNIEHHFNLTVVKKQKGGAGAGEYVLSYEGEALLGACKALRHETDIAMRSIAKMFFNRVNDISERK